MIFITKKDGIKTLEALRECQDSILKLRQEFDYARDSFNGHLYESDKAEELENRISELEIASDLRLDHDEGWREKIKINEVIKYILKHLNLDLKKGYGIYDKTKS